MSVRMDPLQPTAQLKATDRIWHWGLTARIAGLLVFVSLNLPWCGQIKGVELLRTDGLERFWLFPVAAILLLVIPFAGRRLWRFIIEFAVASALLGGAIYAAVKFRQMRGAGIDLAGAAGLLAWLGAIWGGWRARKLQTPANND